MKLQFTLSSDFSVGSVKEVSNFNKGRFVVEDTVKEAMIYLSERVAKESAISLNESEPLLIDPRLRQAIGSTDYWEGYVRPPKVSRGTLLFQMELLNKQPEGMYMARRMSVDEYGNPTGRYQEVGVHVTNLARVRLNPPRRVVTPTGNPKDAPATLLTFYVGGKYIRTRNTRARGGHERYKNHIIGTVKATWKDVLEV